jgi:DNA-binding PadR family transcriptional regulator
MSEGVGLGSGSGMRGWGAIRSPVYWALLGLVIERPGYGYELLKRFERDFCETLPLSSQSHVYRALGVLAERGLIEEVPGTGVRQPGRVRQPKPHYRATVEGVRAYRDWLLAQADAGRRQWSLFVRLLAVFAREPDAAIEIIDRYEQSCLHDGGDIHASPSSGPSAEAASRLAGWLGSEESRLTLDARLTWVEYARDKFKAIGIVASDSHPASLA